MSTQTWKSLLSFTERFAVIDQIASALKLDPEVQHSQALKSAQAVETECFNDAYSEENYIQLWKARLQELKAAQASIFPPFSPSLLPTGGSSPVHSPSSPGITLGAYTPCHHTDSGIFSTIYRAPTPAHLSATTTATHVALKLTTPSTTLPPHDSRRESRILTALGHHPSIIPLLESFTLSSNFILVFPFLPHTLGTLLTTHPSPQQLTRILHATASALSWTHSHGVLHRDVKPSNILLSGTEEVFLADFGIAWSATDNTEPADMKITDVGTTSYRPPELLFGYRAYGTALDMWAFGCTVAECFMDVAEEGVTFFDAGDLGSELRLVASIFQKLGTPGVEEWPETAKFPDFGKIVFHQFPKKSWEELLPRASPAVRDLVGKLLVYESSRRMSAEEVLKHEVFRT